jgi:serine/threonine protein kinase
MNIVTYEQKYNFYKKNKNYSKYLNKCNKYLFKMGIYEININSIGGNYNEIDFKQTVSTITFTLKKKNDGILYHLKDHHFLGRGSFGSVSEYKLYEEDKEIKRVVIKRFNDPKLYYDEKGVYLSLKRNGLNDKVSCKLLYFDDTQLILIFDYLGVTLYDLNFTRISIFDRLKMIEDLCNENLEFFSHEYVHNDLKLKNIVYSSSTKKLSLIDYGLAFKVRDDPMIITTSYEALSSYHSEILEVCDTVLTMNEEEDITVLCKQYKKYVYRTQLYTIGLISACILTGYTGYLKYAEMKQYFGIYDETNYRQNFTKFGEDDCKQYIRNILYDMRLEVKNYEPLSRKIIFDLLEFLCYFGYYEDELLSDEKTLLEKLRDKISAIRFLQRNNAVSQRPINTPIRKTHYNLEDNDFNNLEDNDFNNY